jgi:tRNA (cytidine/uridine-2'-O-)-methyltransferase
MVPGFVRIVLVEPEIPPNTGNIARLCAALGAELHLVEPLGFDLSDRTLRRAGMDYWEHVRRQVWPSFDRLWAEHGAKEGWTFFTTKAVRPYWDAKFRPGDWLVFGRETRGLPETLLAAHAAACHTIPMPGMAGRSLNLATAVAMAAGEALRQMHCEAGI